MMYEVLSEDFVNINIFGRWQEEDGEIELLLIDNDIEEVEYIVKNIF